MMLETQYTPLFDRGIIEISGEDRKIFLQGLISNDIEKVSENHAIYAALLTPQGKYLFDFFIIEVSDSLYLDCQLNRLSALIKKLSIYKLRARVNLFDRSNDFEVIAAFGGDAPSKFSLKKNMGTAKVIAESTVYVDPRTWLGGVRILTPKNSSTKLIDIFHIKQADWNKFDHFRITLGLPDGDRDLIPEKSILLESGFEELNGIDWNKGCYMGQELTARTKYRGLIKKRLIPVTIEGHTPTFGTHITEQGKKIGEMRSTAEDVGIALIRLDHITSESFLASETILRPKKPSWANF